MPITIDEPEVKRMYIGTRFADKVEQGAQNLMIGAAHRVQEMAKDQPGLLDDAIRLVGGGIKNVRNLAKDQEGIHDDMLRLAGGGIKNTLKIAGLTGEIGGWAGGKIAGALGVDPRIGRTVGGFAGDAVTLGGTVKALKIGAKGIKKGYKGFKTAKGTIGSLLEGGITGHAGTGLKKGALSTAERAGLKIKQPKVSALGRYDDFTRQGYELSESITKQAEAIRKPNYGNRLKGLKQWTDETAYRNAAQRHYDKTGVSSDIRTKIGVLVDPKSGEVFQMKSRSAGPKLSLRSWSEQANTTLNRNLSKAQQQAANVVAHDSPKNVATLMERMNFKGTAKEFTSKYAIHHKRSIVAYEPFFYKLSGKESTQLRKLIEADGIKLGDNIENLVAIPKKMHTLDKKSIHTLMRKHGIEGVSKDWDGIVGSYDAQASLRKRFAKASVPQRYKAFKLYQEYVQNPTDDMLNEILAAMK